MGRFADAKRWPARPAKDMRGSFGQLLKEIKSRRLEITATEDLHVDPRAWRLHVRSLDTGEDKGTRHCTWNYRTNKWAIVIEGRQAA